jgi:hypothetical protein
MFKNWVIQVSNYAAFESNAEQFFEALLRPLRLFQKFGIFRGAGQVNACGLIGDDLDPSSHR